MVVPGNLLQHANRFVIHIKADRSRRAGVPRVIIGPQEDVEQIYLREVRVYVVGTLVVTILSLLVGTISLSLWFTQGSPLPGRGKQRDHLYLFAGLAEFIWALRIGSVLIEQPPLPWDWWGPVIALSMGAWTVCMTVFCFSVAGWTHKPWARWAYWMFAVFMLAGVPATILGREYPWALTAWYAVNNTLVIPFAIAFVWTAMRKASRTHIIVAGAAMLNVLVGVRDWIVLRASDSFGETALIRYSSVVFGLSLGYIVVMRFRDATTQARDLMDTLALRVAQKEAELKTSYEQVEQLARAQERLAERSRILRDMHDGVGSHISSAIRQLQSGHASNEDLLLTLHDSLDQLKLSIDAMNLPPGDITALLANMRYRLGPRFSASDIELQWAVSQLPIREGLDMQATRHLQFMLYEALSNVLQHAHASILRIEGQHSAESGSTVLRVIDNGCGFDPASQPLRSLTSIRERAAAIGARIDVHSQPGHTELAIWL
jgi:signal transduction histidine kinase